MKSVKRGNKGRITVLQVIETTGPGGAETVLTQLAHHLSKSGFKPLVALTGDGWLNQRLKALRVKTHLVTTDRSMGLRFFIRLLRLIRRERISLLHAHLDDTSFYVTLAGIVTRKPVIATFHGLIGSFWESGWKGRIKRMVVRRGANYLVTVSHYLREEIITRLRVSPDKVKAIHNGVSFESTTASVPTDSLRSRLNVPGNTTIIGCVGNVRASKGYEFMIEAARELDRRGYEFRLLIAGQTGGALFTELTAAVIEGGLSDRVSFLGFCDDVRSFLREIDIYVLPSTTEGLSISTIEAMAAGKPVVVTRSGGPTEIVEDNSTGLTVPVSDANAIAEKVAYLIDNPTDAKEIADRGMKSVRKRFDLKISMAKYESLYGELLDKE